MAGPSIAITIRGVTWASHRALADEMGVTACAVSLAKREGRLERMVAERLGLGEEVAAPVEVPAPQPAPEPQAAPRRRLAVPKDLSADVSPVSPQPISQATTRAARRLAPVFHPRWSSKVDFFILQLRGDGENFTGIAQVLGLTRLSVEQRWHRLRAIRDIGDLLVDYGLSDAPYPGPGVRP